MRGCGSWFGCVTVWGLLIAALDLTCVVGNLSMCFLTRLRKISAFPHLFVIQAIYPGGIHAFFQWPAFFTQHSLITSLEDLSHLRHITY